MGLPELALPLACDIVVKLELLMRFVSHLLVMMMIAVKAARRLALIVRQRCGARGSTYC